MAGKHDRDGVPAVRRPDGASGLGTSEAAGLLAVADGRAEWDRRQRQPRPLLEGRSHELEWEIEGGPLAREVL
jgi:hypothetical protein